MEGGNKVNIPLDAPIDTQSSDMLVPVHSPKFEHNRQQYQGRALSNSVRFESDGWAAGDTIYDFDIDEPYLRQGDYKIYRYKGEQYGTYILELWHVEEDKDVHCATVLVNYDHAIKALYNIPEENIQENVSYLGCEIQVTFNGITVNISRDKVSRYYLTNSDHTFYYGDLRLETTINESGTVDFKIKDTRTEQQITITVTKPTAIYAKSNLVDGEPYKLADFESVASDVSSSSSVWRQSAIRIGLTAPRIASNSVTMNVEGLPGESVTPGSASTVAYDGALVLQYSFAVVQRLKYNMSFNSTNMITGMYNMSKTYPNDYQSVVPVAADENNINGTTQPGSVKFEINTDSSIMTKDNPVTVKAEVPLWNSLRLRSDFDIANSPYTCTNYKGNSPQVVKLCTFSNVELLSHRYFGTKARVSGTPKLTISVYATTVPASVLVAGSSNNTRKVDQSSRRPTELKSNTYTAYFASTKETLSWVSWGIPYCDYAYDDRQHGQTHDTLAETSDAVLNYWLFDYAYYKNKMSISGYSGAYGFNNNSDYVMQNPAESIGGVSVTALVFEYKDSNNTRQVTNTAMITGCFDNSYNEAGWLFSSSSTTTTDGERNYTSFASVAKEIIERQYYNMSVDADFDDEVRYCSNLTAATHFRAQYTLAKVCSNDVSSGSFTPYKNRHVASSVYSKLVDPKEGYGEESIVYNASELDSDIQLFNFNSDGGSNGLYFGTQVTIKGINTSTQEDFTEHAMLIGKTALGVTSEHIIQQKLNSITSFAYTFYSDSAIPLGSSTTAVSVATATFDHSRVSKPYENLFYTVDSITCSFEAVEPFDTVTFSYFGWRDDLDPSKHVFGILEPTALSNYPRNCLSYNTDYFSASYSQSPYSDTYDHTDVTSKVKNKGIYPQVGNNDTTQLQLSTDVVVNKTGICCVATQLSTVESAIDITPDTVQEMLRTSGSFMQLNGNQLRFNATGTSEYYDTSNHTCISISTISYEYGTGSNLLADVCYGATEDCIKSQEYVTNNYTTENTYFGAVMIYPVNTATMQPPSFTVDDTTFIDLCRAVHGGELYKYTDINSTIYTFKRLLGLADTFSLKDSRYSHSKDMKFSKASTKPTIDHYTDDVTVESIIAKKYMYADRTLSGLGYNMLTLSIDNKSSVDGKFDGRINILFNILSGDSQLSLPYFDYPITNDKEWSPVHAFDKGMYYIIIPDSDSAAEADSKYNAYVNISADTALFKYFKNRDDISVFMSPAGGLVTHDFYRSTLPTMPNHVAVYDMTTAKFNTQIVGSEIKLANDSKYQYLLLCLNYDPTDEAPPAQSCVLLRYSLEPETDGSNIVEIITVKADADDISINNYVWKSDNTYSTESASISNAFFFIRNPYTTQTEGIALQGPAGAYIKYNKCDYAYTGNLGTYTINVEGISGGVMSFPLPDPEQLATSEGVNDVPYLNASVSLTYESPDVGTLDNTGNNYCNVLPDVVNSSSNAKLPMNISDGEISTVYNGNSVSINLFSGVMQYKDDTFQPSGNFNKQYLFDVSYYEYCKILARLFGPYVAYTQEGFTVDRMYGTTNSPLPPIGEYNKVQIWMQQGQESPVSIDINMSDILGSAYDNAITFKYGVPEQPEETFDSTGPAVPIATLNFDDEYQFLKQQWEVTDKVENFWFVNPYGDILELNKFDFVYKTRLEDEVDDWNGNEYSVKYTVAKNTIITSDVVKYGVTNVNASGNPATSVLKAYLWTLKLTDGNLTLSLYDLIGSTITLQSSYDLVINKVNIGEVLNRSVQVSKLNTYSDITASDLAFDAAYSATAVAGKVVFGIHLDSNFNQWAIVIDTTNNLVTKIIQGYGYVGLDGTLTGGQIPDKYFDSTKGFSDTVWPLDYLNTYNGTQDSEREVKSIAELYTLPSVVVGTDVQQWYIDTKLSGIVSRLSFNQDSGDFTKVVLPITNSYSVVYDSPSFYTRMITDKDIKRKFFQDIIPDFDNIDSNVKKLFQTFMMFAANPVIYLTIPRISLSGYLQQTLGQYAYVHYTSNNVTVQKEDAKKSDLQEESGLDINDEEEVETTTSYNKLVSSDELSFNTQVVKQTAKADEYQFPFLLFTLSALAVSAANMLIDKLQVNNKQNQSSTSDKGRKFSQVFLQNMDALSASNMNQSGLTPTMTSVVAGTCTLDMFYSTADKQHIYAGPGFVSHNFVAQCVAQSVTSTHFELNQLSMQYIFKHLTLFPTMLLVKALEATQKLLYEEANITGRLEVTAMGSGTNAAGVAAGIVLAIFAEALNATIKLYNTFLNFAEKILDALGGEQLQSNVTAMQSRHTYDIEGKHKYGEKNETFMWPCWCCGENKPYSDETVVGKTDNKVWSLHQKKWDATILKPGTYGNNTDIITDATIPFVTRKTSDAARLTWQSDEVAYFIANCYGKSTEVLLPNDYAYVIGTEAFLSKTPFRNENIDCSEPVFATQVAQDYIIDRNWRLSRTTAMGKTVWISCDDTKVIDGEPSNIVVTPFFCGVASPYTAIEIRRGVNPKFIRPWAITPDALALNNTGKNVIYKRKLYHAFDGIGQRLVNWVGPAAMNKQKRAMHYCFQVNDRFKRSNKLPPSQWFGNFDSSPVVAVDVDIEDKLYNDVMMPSKNIGMDAGVVGEYKNVTRYSLPVFSEFINMLPATVRTLAPYKLAVVDGITSLTTDMRNTQSAYKAPESIDFTINKQIYRMTPEYICSVRTEKGVTVTEDLCPTLGLTYIGATPFEAFFYSQATRQYYSYTGGTSLTVVDMMERFRDIQSGKYDFISQQVVMQCLSTFDRLDRFVHDDSDETDNIMVLLFKDRSVSGELQPPTTVLFNSNSWFKIISMPTGVVYQGPNRCSINRAICNEYMYKGITDNAQSNSWIKMSREDYHPFRTYIDTNGDEYRFTSITADRASQHIALMGWTHNPFLLVTSPLGISQEVDCIYEWTVTFAWTHDMVNIYTGEEFYACVNVMAETYANGGKVLSRPTHVYLTRNLFARSNNPGYYSFTYQSKNGAGNRERLHIWCDSFIAISSIQCEYKPITEKRNSVLTSQSDVSGMKEF